MLEALKVIILGIIEGITEWLPISSTGHLILVEEFIHLDLSEEFVEMFNIVIQFGAILAVILLYFHKLNPFANDKSKKQQMLTIQLWIKVAIATIPAMIFGLLFDDYVDEHFMNAYVVAAMLILYGVLYIIVERRNEHRSPIATRLTQLSIPMALAIGGFQVLAIIPGTSRSGATILGGLLIGASRGVAAEFTFFLAIPVMFGWSALKMLKFGFAFTGQEFGLLILGCVAAFGVSVFVIKFLMQYIKNHDFKVFGYYRIVLGIIVFLYFGITALFSI